MRRAGAVTTWYTVSEHACMHTYIQARTFSLSRGEPSRRSDYRIHSVRACMHTYVYTYIHTSTHLHSEPRRAGAVTTGYTVSEHACIHTYIQARTFTPSRGEASRRSDCRVHSVRALLHNDVYLRLACNEGFRDTVHRHQFVHCVVEAEIVEVDVCIAHLYVHVCMYVCMYVPRHPFVHCVVEAEILEVDVCIAHLYVHVCMYVCLYVDLHPFVYCCG